MISRGDDGRDRDPLIRERLFPLGRLLMTPGAQREVPPSEMMQALRRHAKGDWGDVCEEDWRSNDAALKYDRRLLSSYETKSGTKFWIISEGNREATTVLLPEEY